MRIYDCGCVNSFHPETGAWRSFRKCDWHLSRQRRPESLEAGYYAELGALSEEITEVYIRELEEGIGRPLPPANGPSARALEIGCGTSHYVPLVRRAGYSYLGLDPSEWVRSWMWQRWQAPVLTTFWEDFQIDQNYDLILAAHVLEHLPNAFEGLKKITACLKPGGYSVLVLPDDRDPVNPDHLWFFDEAAVRRSVDLAGLRLLSLGKYSRVAHEDFFYILAVRPEVEPAEESSGSEPFFA